MEPQENADIDEWKQWAYRLKNRAIRAEEIKNKAMAEVAVLRQDIAEKDKAFRYYKSEIANLENTITNIKRNPSYRICKFICSIRGRIISIYNAIMKRKV